MRSLLARHFKDLLLLQAIVDAGSINRAAKVIGLSQPALTRSIGRLEADIGVQLLTRVAKGVYPTEFGQALLEHVRLAGAELDQAETQLRIIKSRSSSQLACGGTFVPMGYLIPQAVKDFGDRKPDSHVRLVEGTTDGLLQMLRVGELEVVVCPKMDAQKDDDLTSEVLVIERVGIFADSQHPLLKEKNNSLQKIVSSERWILPDRTGQLRQLLIREFARHSVEIPERFVETASLTAARRLINITSFVAFSTSLLVAPDLLAGTTREIQGNWQFPTTTLSLFHRTEKLSTSALYFVECLRRAARSLPVPEAALGGRTKGRHIPAADKGNPVSH
jgi:LysR family transcriptional regulator of gallate degradation